MFVLNGASRRAARGARRDHSVIVIAFMMALVFVPVLGMHAAVSAGSALDCPSVRSCPCAG